MAKKKKKKVSIKRNGDVLASYKREINLQTKIIKDKKKYSRKNKHKAKDVT
jgi:hypothetical protein